MKTLDELRKEIDAVDEQILIFIGKRRRIVKEIGEYKKAFNLPIVDPNREADKLNKLQEKGKANDIPANVITAIWKTFYQDAYEVEK